MRIMNNFKLIWASALAAIITGIAVAGVTIVSDLYVPLKDMLKTLTGHHWITKSLGSIILYLILWGIFGASVGDKSVEQGRRMLWSLFVFTILSALAIFAFYIWHYLAV